MSGEAMAAMGGNRRQRVATAKTVAATCRPLPPLLLPSISHPPDLAAVVVTDQERAIRRDENSDRPSPARAIGTLPAIDELLYAHRATPTTIDHDPHDFRTCRDRAVPRSMQCQERIAAILAGELRARVEREAERRGVRLHGDRRRLDVRAVRRSVLGIGFAGQVALRPAVVAAVLDDVDVLGRHVIAEIIAVVVPTPQLARFWIECQTDRIAKALREYVAARTIGVELRDRRPHRVALGAEIAGGAHGHVHLAVGSEENRPRRMTAARQAHDRHRLAGARIEADELALLSDVHRVAAEGDAERSLQSARDRHYTVGHAVMVCVGQLDDQT